MNEEEQSLRESLEPVDDIVTPAALSADGETVLPPEGEPLDASAKTLSPTMLVLKRFFRSKLSIVGLTMIIVLFLFAFLGPVIFNRWGETEIDRNGKEQVEIIVVPGTDPEVVQVTITTLGDSKLMAPSARHWLGTDQEGQDVFTRCMYGGRISLLISLIVVILETVLGVILGGLAGYFGKWVDQLIMRIVDIIGCIPTLPLLLLFGQLFDAYAHVHPAMDPSMRIYFLMAVLTLLGWSGTARIVRGQILYLREQEYMTAAEAMGLSTPRKIFKHLIPNVMPQLIVSMTLGLGSTILYEASLSFLNLGVKAPYAAWGTMVNAVNNTSVLRDNVWVWLPPGLLIIMAVLAFNFLGDGLRDALDPRMKR